MNPVTALTGLATIALATSCTSVAPAPEGWTLVWSDEFEGDTIDESRWRVEHAAVIKNNELQFYHPDDVFLKDGNLILRSRANPHGGRAFTSGLVDTQDRFSQTYGRFEVRARLPRGRGIWPAHWMLPEDHPGWPPEIDIMEQLGHEPDTVHLTQHWGTWPDNGSAGTAFTGSDLTTDFHLYAVEWSPDRIDWFVDGVLRHSSTQHIPRIPFYLILNTAVGGDWPGNPDETTEFPQSHAIDYVRVYQRDIPDRTLLAIRSQHGSVTTEPARADFEPGESVRLSATPDFGHAFDGWAGIDATEPTVTVRMDRSALTARFVRDPALAPRLQVASATASSAEIPELGAANTIDGLPGTRWSSAFSAPQTLTLDLADTHRVQKIRILWENAHPSRFTLEASTDATQWNTITERTKPDAAPDVVDVDAPARYLRLTCTDRATRWGISVWEFEVYGNSHRPDADPD